MWYETSQTACCSSGLPIIVYGGDGAYVAEEMYASIPRDRRPGAPGPPGPCYQWSPGP